MQHLWLFVLIAIVWAMPEMWIHGCQPAIKDVVMGTHIQNDATYNKCNLTLSMGDIRYPLSNIDPWQNYTISFRPNFGQVEIHALISATSGKIDVGTGYGTKDKCSQDGMTGVLWRGITDPNGVTDIFFKFYPLGNPNIKFAVTCSEGIGNPVYQDVLLIGNYTLPVLDDGSASIALAVVVLLMIILPISGIAIYCLWVKCKDRILTRPDASSVPGKEEEEEEEDEKPKKPRKDTHKYENIKDDD